MSKFGKIFKYFNSRSISKAIQSISYKTLTVSNPLEIISNFGKKYADQ